MSKTGSSNVGDTLPTGQLSTIPWRRADVKYTNNEAYFDVIEEIDAILDKSGTTVFAEIQGIIEACVRLTGMPDLTMSFMNPRLLDDVSFHPCVRFKRWESERALSFIPPDGHFTLMNYHVSSQNPVAIPVYVKQSISFFESGPSGRLDITIGPKQTMGKTVEALMVKIHMPKAVLSANLTATQGSYTYDSPNKVTTVHKAIHSSDTPFVQIIFQNLVKCFTAELLTSYLPTSLVLIWDIGKLNPQKLPNLKGTLSLQAGAPKPEDNPSLNIDLRIQQVAISGLKVSRLEMFGEKYKPFKGVKLVLMRLSVHCLATSLASLVTSSEALAMSLAHWIIARLFPLPPRTSRDISAISRAIRLAAAMMSLPWEESGGG
ncbi:AP-3 complex subunit mu-1 [Liparis tanakae]|uniref:AP-3 complex subunit mu-1 n=1 Tax=Liparis tanakae TaxID=230148 RepID=A0A4Z2GS62_9TELE|nr:AP-3 complex subunit mu-1 [Liparis tanakae]